MPPKPDVIRARTNTVLKRARSVGRGKHPGFVLLEGERVILDALGAGHVPEVLLVDEAITETAQALIHRPETRLCATGLLDGIGALRTSPGIAGVFTEPASVSLATMITDSGSGPTLILGVAGVADPGNLGALARVAEAAGAAALVVAPGGARPFGPKALRGSMGSLFRLPVVQPDSLEHALASLTDAGFEHHVAATRDGESMHACAFARRTVLWVTSETGEAPPALAATALGVTIPMRGSVESLNVTVAGALLAFAASQKILGSTEA